MRNIHFVKMQAAGNDFILLDARGLEQEWSELARAMCPRHFGIGADGLILLLPSEEAHFKMRVFNPDGSEAETCGNGLICFFKYVLENGLIDGHELKVETSSGIKAAWSEGGRIRVGMGVPKFAPDEVPVKLEGEKLDITPILDYPVAVAESNVAKRELKLNILSMGNPHAVCFLDESVIRFSLPAVGPTVEEHSIFPMRTNFEVASVLDRCRILARVWERGVGETTSCGSGACAIAVAARLHDLIDEQVMIMMPGGVLFVDWDGEGEVFLSGGAETVFEGEWKT